MHQYVERVGQGPTKIVRSKTHFVKRFIGGEVVLTTNIDEAEEFIDTETAFMALHKWQGMVMLRGESAVKVETGAA